MMNHIPIGLEVSVRFVLRVVLVSLVVAFGVLALILVAPKVVGGQSLSVLSGSMSPAVDTGDMVVIVPQAAEDIEIGQIVAFNDPNGTGDLYQHRVQYVGESGNTIQVVTKGDANVSGEKWQTRPGSEVGRVALVVPKIGLAIGTLTGGKPVVLAGREVPLGTLLIIIGLFVFGAIVIVQILRSGKTDDPEDDQQTDFTSGLLEANHELQEERLSPHATGHIHQQQEGPHHA